MAPLPTKKLIFAAAAFFFGAALLSLCLGAARLPLPELWQAAINGPGSAGGRIFWYVRLPRTAACLLAGAALAVSGAVIQGVLANRLASPGIIGVNAGAGLAVTLCCAFGAVSGWIIASGAFFGAMAAVLLISLTAQRVGASRTTVILGGVAVNSFFGALTEGVTALFPEVGMLSVDFRVGGFGAVYHGRLIPAAVIILASLTAVLTLCGELDLMLLGEETAHSLGLSVKRMRTLFLILAALLAGAAVSFAGLLGFVGLIVPHAVRRFTGSQSARLLPVCALGGGGFVALCDLAARTAFSPHELPAGILMSVLGGPFFIALLLKTKGGRQP